MAVLRIDRKASDNAYLHKDFHGALSTGLDYLRRQYGDESVRDFLRRFTHAWHAPLMAELRKRGLPALRAHYEAVFAREGGTVRMTETDDSLLIECLENPAVRHLREHGYAVSPLFHETVAAVGRALCEGSPYAAELIRYEPKTGAYTQRFFRRAA